MASGQVRQGQLLDVGSLSAGMKVTLTCPSCGERGLVDWRNLKNGIGCPKCDCKFIIGRNGRVLSQSELPHIKFTCPRCKYSDALPTVLTSNGTRCKSCGLELMVGPDQRIHSVREAEELWRVDRAAPPKRSLFDALTGALTTADGRLRRDIVSATIAVAAAGAILLGWVLYSLFDSSPEAQVRRMAKVCLAADWDAAREFIGEDAVQQVEFDRWRTRHFSSILDKHRPAGDRVTVEVATSESDTDRRTFLVTLKSPFLGSRSHVECWYVRDGVWRFDARRTLETETPSRRPGRPRSPPKPQLPRQLSRLP